MIHVSRNRDLMTQTLVIDFSPRISQVDCTHPCSTVGQDLILLLWHHPAPPATGHLHRPICERLRAPCCHELVAHQHYPPIREIKSQSGTFLHTELQLSSVITKRISNPYTRAHLMISSCTHANFAYLTVTIFFFSFFRKPTLTRSW